MNDPNFICKCGHRKDHHEFLYEMTGDPEEPMSWCATNEIQDCFCDDYQPDNLKYLESKYE